MHLAGASSWSVSIGRADNLAVLLAVRELADLPFYDASIPEPLEPTPTIERLFTGQHVRKAAAEPWGALWRIALAGHTARAREAGVEAAPPLYGLPTFWTPDPPKFGSLASAPELKQIFVSTWPAITTWLARQPERDTWSSNWPADLVARVEQVKGEPIADVTVQLDTLPVRGTRHWVLSQDRERRSLHALVSADLLSHPEQHNEWLSQALHRIG